MRSQGSCVSVSGFMSPGIGMHHPCRADVSVGPPGIARAAHAPSRDDAVPWGRRRFRSGNARFLDLLAPRPIGGRDVRKSRGYMARVILVPMPDLDRRPRMIARLRSASWRDLVIVT